MRFFGPDHDYLIVNEHPRDDLPTQTDKIKVQYLTSDKPAGITGSTQDLSYLEGIEKCDKVIYSVTSYWNLKKTFGNDEKFWRKTTTVLEIFFEHCASKKIVGITGTKGKGTTSTLMHLMLKAAGFNSYLGGNIGVSVLDFVNDVKPDDWVVLELSSFQLFYFPFSPHIAVCLKITPEHLDWHPNLDDYIRAKANIFAHQTEDDLAIYFAGNRYSQTIAGYSKGKKIPYFAAPGARIEENRIVVGEAGTPVINTNEIKLLGAHNLENICAAATAFWQISQDVRPILRVLTTFTGLEHRLEFVREIDGVKYYDDSFGTTPDTAITALKAIKSPKVMIVGGVDKGIPFEGLADEIAKDRVSHVIAIGHTGPKIAQLLADRGFKNVTLGLKTMPEIVNKAREVARAGDAVLLAPAGSSYDMFFDYKDRGEQFKQAVAALDRVV